MKYFLQVCIYIPIMHFSISAFTQNSRKEIELTYPSEHYNIIPINAEGIILFTDKESKTDDVKKSWIFIKYDTDFIEEWSKEFELPRNLFLEKYYSQEKKLYLLFKYGYESLILSLETSTGIIKTFNYRSISFAFKDINVFKVIDTIAYIGGNKTPPKKELRFKSFLSFTLLPIFIPSLNIKYDAFVTAGNLETKSTIEIPLIPKSESTVIDLELNNRTKSIYSIIDATIEKKSVFLLKEINRNGEVIKTSLINPEYNTQLINGKLTIINDEEQLLVGTWTRNNRTGSQGIYFAKIKDAKLNFIKQYSYTDFKSFFNYLSDFDKTTLENKVTAKQERGKDLNVNYNIVVHEIIERKKQAIHFIGRGILSTVSNPFLLCSNWKWRLLAKSISICRIQIYTCNCSRI